MTCTTSTDYPRTRRHDDGAGGPFILCPACHHREPLVNGRGPVGSKVWTCPNHGDYGPGVER